MNVEATPRYPELVIASSDCATKRCFKREAKGISKDRRTFIYFVSDEIKLAPVAHLGIARRHWAVGPVDKAEEAFAYTMDIDQSYYALASESLESIRLDWARELNRYKRKARRKGIKRVFRGRKNYEQRVLGELGGYAKPSKWRW